MYFSTLMIMLNSIVRFCCYIDFSKLLHGFVKNLYMDFYKLLYKLLYMDLSKMLNGFVIKVVSWIVQSCSMYFSAFANKTKFEL